MICISLAFINVCYSSMKDEEKPKKILFKSSTIADPQIASDNGIKYRSIAKKRLKSGNALSNENEDKSKPFLVKKKMKILRKSGEKNIQLRGHLKNTDTFWALFGPPPPPRM